MSALSVSERTKEQQRLATDPTRSVFVSANAGSGKTHVLTERVVRLLLSGSDPSKILCLTFTKAAAAEMANRVFKRLGAWAIASEDALAKELEALEERPPSPERIADARQLFAKALETPGGLKIQTIHAFCEAILHQFPLEANVPAHFDVLDDAESRLMLGEARRRLITGAAAAAAGEEAAAELTAAFSEALSLGGEFGLDRLLQEIVAKRDDIRRHVESCGGLEGAIALLTRALGLSPRDDEARLLSDLGEPDGFDASFRVAVLAAAETSDKKTDQTTADILSRLIDSQDGYERLALLKRLCQTQKGDPRKASSVLTKAVAAKFPDFDERLSALQDHLKSVEDRLATLRLFRASRAALVIADAFERDYARLKRRRGKLDFTDLIARTADLLLRTEASAWVHYKLDQGIDHILIDEAQDTSPRQWQVMRQLIDEFFAGKGSHNRPRSVFAVGDEKQSIYSFQGASPHMFDEERRTVATKAEDARLGFATVTLNQSFRTVETILQAVDTVFAVPENRAGLSASGEAPTHDAARRDGPGLVEVWPVIQAESKIEPEDWTTPIDEEPKSSPAFRLAKRIADQIGDWIGDTILHRGEPKTLNAGDFLILVRNRTGFVSAMAAALRDKHIGVAGTDRLVITNHIAVQDLMALGRVVANFEDDLSLAAVLKSPLFGFTDDELMALALSRGEREHLSLGLRRLAGDEGSARIPEWFADGAPAAKLLEKAKAAMARLDDLRDRAGFESVFTFYARILGPEGGRKQLMARLGPDTADVVDAFLDLALAEEAAGVSGLDGFLADLEAAPPEIKREMEQGRREVRIMTAHASKGLEAPVVFLVDPGSAPFSHTHGARLMRWDGMAGTLYPGQAPGFLWRASKDVETAVLTGLRESERRLAEEEYRRLLYVGMTRAADRLVVCGLGGVRKPGPDVWRSRVENALAETATTIEDQDGEPIAWRIGERGKRESAPSAGPLSKFDDAAPALDLSLLAPEDLPPRPLTPSSAGAGLETETPDDLASAGEAASEFGQEGAPPLSPILDGVDGPSFAIRRGLIVHRLLQHLPDIDPAERRSVAEAYLARTASDITAHHRAHLRDTVEQVLDDPSFAIAFKAQSRAEVAIGGTVRFHGADYQVSGTIDRLAVSEHEVLIVDYKTNRPPPSTIEAVPAEYVTQLAIYRALLEPLYPGRRVRAVLLFTEGPHWIELPAEVMDKTLAGRKPARAGEDEGRAGA
ncbi:MAG: double-strand break repair helicase AddA [Fulvimarina manganoxydans]|uniref:double-strand break repair helicase AddA n=1 Tax=Fulvimarina manganoxydans TaxID=937218 RepID=UPI0023560001|nr:double-strand break repair helicase AddA [Fulvimarina manganoxydans]MCK5933181.1 double-strand break repair helicase AddA [Fulvimarina manganoxydans]